MDAKFSLHEFPQQALLLIVQKFWRKEFQKFILAGLSI
jgi:hypothetical protein